MSETELCALFALYSIFIKASIKQSSLQSSFNSKETKAQKVSKLPMSNRQEVKVKEMEATLNPVSQTEDHVLKHNSISACP